MSADREKHLAMILRALELSEREFADYRADHRARVEHLRNQAAALSDEILSGQETLPLDKPPEAA